MYYDKVRKTRKREKKEFVLKPILGGEFEDFEIGKVRVV
jgi:hypothetical protein